MPLRSGGDRPYFFASRAKDASELKMNGSKKADGVDIVAYYGDRIVLVKQYRVPIDGYVYECPAGLIDEGEEAQDAAVRELFEETGLTLHPESAPEGGYRGFYTSVGMSDEACAVVYGQATGEVSTKGLEDSENLTVVLADKKEAERILAREPLSLRCALALREFIKG